MTQPVGRDGAEKVWQDPGYPILPGGGPNATAISGRGAVNCSRWQRMQWSIKFVIEWFAALVLLVLTAPLQIVAAIAIKLDSRGPALFIQERLGRDGKPFRMYKFRGLRWEPGAPLKLNPDGSTRVDADDERLTRVGRWLRVGWDELPQLINVLKGEMAIVGPRPELPFHRKFYTPQEERKLTVLPGITGLAQARGRNEIPWKQRIALDLEYIDHYSLWLDLTVVARTLRILISRRGLFTISHRHGHKHEAATVPLLPEPTPPKARYARRLEVRRSFMPKILCVFGTRPEAIKMAPVIRALAARSDRLSCSVCVTAQHRHMLDQVLNLFGITPDYDLDVMEEGQTPSQVASAVLSRLDPILRRERPDWVLVQGDTTTVAAASLAAFYAGVAVGHVEAGLRTHNKWRPFPEEINRRLAGVIADLHFAPTHEAGQSLLREGVAGEKIFVTGNTVIDALHWAAAQPYDPATLPLDARCWADPDMRVLLVTVHRRESFGQPLEGICQAIRSLALGGNGHLKIIYPVHLNPAVRRPAHRILGDVPNVSLLPPLEYLQLVNTMKRSYLILTDSGGIQEEAPGFGKPVLVLRDQTERPEAVTAGTAKVIGTDPDRIVAETLKLLDDKKAYQRMARAINPFGDGHAAQRIAAAILGEPMAPFRPTVGPQ